jgi:hypothetical protein
MAREETVRLILTGERERSSLPLATEVIGPLWREPRRRVGDGARFPGGGEVSGEREVSAGAAPSSVQPLSALEDQDA